MSRGPPGLSDRFWPCCGAQVPFCLHWSWAAVYGPLQIQLHSFSFSPLTGLSGCCMFSRCFRQPSLKAASPTGQIGPGVHVCTSRTGSSQYPVMAIFIVSAFHVPVSSKKNISDILRLHTKSTEVMFSAFLVLGGKGGGVGSGMSHQAVRGSRRCGFHIPEARMRLSSGLPPPR